MANKLILNPKYPQLLKLKVGVIRGGRSAERKISLRSGNAVLAALVRSGVNALPLDPVHKSFTRKIRDFDVLFLVLHGAGGEDGVLQKVLERKGICFTASDSSACKKSFDKLITKKYLEKLRVPTPAYSVISKKDWKSKASSFSVPFF